MILPRITIGILLLFFISCTKSSKDSESPIINSLSISNIAPSVNESFQVIANVSDNENLSAYKIDISNTFYFSDQETFTKARFSYSHNESISGEIFDLNNTITIPDSIATGNYELTLSLVDHKGNISDDKKVSFTITNIIDQPVIYITEPTNTAYVASDTIYANGTISDDINIKECNIYSTNDNGWTNNQTINLDTMVVTSWSLDTDGNIKIPLPSTLGNYSTTVRVIDTTGNENQTTVMYSVN